MLHRRTVLAATSVALLSGVVTARAQSSQQAAAFVQTLGNELTAIVNGPGSTEQKGAALTRIIDADVDVPGVARFVLGRFWRLATPPQQKEYETLFRRVLILSITDKIGEYEGVRFTVGRTTPRAEGQAVSTTIAGPKKAPADVDWIVTDVGGRPKVVDVIAEGTSLRLTQRADYTSFLTQHNNNVQALLDALRRQANANG